MLRSSSWDLRFQSALLKFGSFWQLGVIISEMRVLVSMRGRLHLYIKHHFGFLGHMESRRKGHIVCRCSCRVIVHMYK